VDQLGYLPITEPDEVRTFLRSLPLAVDPDAFMRFALGFPRSYLAGHSPVEVVRHFALMGSLGERPVVSSVAKDGGLWKLCIVARDRSFLFSRIAGALSSFGMDIVAAEAFANANALVLDTFRFADRRSRFEQDGERRRFQAFLEEAVQDKVDLDGLVEARLRDEDAAEPPLALEWQDGVRPRTTCLRLRGVDRPGLLYRVSRVLSEEGCSIELAYVETPGGRVADEFHLASTGAPLGPETKQRIEERLTQATTVPPRDAVSPLPSGERGGGEGNTRDGQV
jgi:[protein-PII] uridylyltransferase